MAVRNERYGGENSRMVLPNVFFVNRRKIVSPINRYAAKSLKLLTAYVLIILIVEHTLVSFQPEQFYYFGDYGGG